MRANRLLARVLQFFFFLRPLSFKAAFADFTSRPNPLDALLVRRGAHLSTLREVSLNSADQLSSGDST